MRSLIPVFVPSLLVGAVLSGCASVNSSVRSDAPPGADPYEAPAPPPGATGGAITNLDEVSIDHDAWARLGFRWNWAGYPTTAPGQSIVELDVDKDRVIARDGTTVVSVLNAATGRRIWGVEVDRPKTRIVGMVRDGERLLVSTETRLHEIEMSSGNLLDRREFGRRVSTEPILAGDLAVYGTPDGELLALNRTLGLVEWRYTVGGQILSNLTKVNDTTVGVVSDSGTVMFVDTRGPTSIGVNRINGGVASDPVSDGYDMYVASEDQSVYRFKPEDAIQIWRERTAEKLRVQPVVHADRLYYASSERGLVCLATVGPNAGQELWSQPGLPNGWVVGVNGGELIVWNGGALASVDPENGDVIASAPMPGIGGVRTDSFEDGNLYVVAGKRTILKFSPR